ncbi:isovaleryl-CoA dehydrogenase [Neptuniibacter sp. CAU 1671]|uniref:isovaleryl-CoA dehydrogenase n=1 Tax=Neptuniibacter sp. CAU 1671 TaxID=3032593 RepID=UPI0023DA1005|nr:isovaleryl-CoA dehydrogenase [Neptuniibacter sp. CAU 1671]MDF2180877.1 isovaleryl-CoA dehydrogenase [Neptuniibacter sp. CAU 1671]
MFYTEPDFGLDETHRLLAEQVTQFARREIAPLAAQIDLDNQFPQPLWRAMGALGLLGVTAPEEYGGAGLGYLAQSLIMEALSRASGSVALSYGAHANLCVNQLVRNGSDIQKQQFLPDLISGKTVGALAMSEPNAGSDVMSMQLKATPEGSGYRLNGHKMWITNGPDADLLIVYAKTSTSPDHPAITAFLVEGNNPGLTRLNKLDKLGMRGSNTCELCFDDCYVAETAILGARDKGTEVLMSGLDYERLVLAAGPVGLMQAALDTCLPYCRERHQFGKPIGEFELVQGKLADMYSRTTAARAYLYTLARAADTGPLQRKDAAGVILYCAELATQIALDAIQLLGANGYMNEYPCGRILRDAKLYEIGAGTSEIRRMLIGRELMLGH